MLAIKRFCYIEVPFIYCTVKPRSSLETRSIHTSHCYGQFTLSLVRNKVGPFSTAPSVSGFTGFDCIISGAENIAYY